MDKASRKAGQRSAVPEEDGFFPPCPSPEGEWVARTRELYLRRTGREITDEQAYDLLARVMRYVWATAGMGASDDHAVPPDQENPPSSNSSKESGGSGNDE